MEQFKEFLELNVDLDTQFTRWAEYNAVCTLLPRDELGVDRKVVEVLNQRYQISQGFTRASLRLQHDVLRFENLRDRRFLDSCERVIFVHLQDVFQLLVDRKVVELVARKHLGLFCFALFVHDFSLNWLRLLGLLFFVSMVCDFGLLLDLSHGGLLDLRNGRWFLRLLYRDCW